jgi:muconolactone D-isomerase
MEFLVTTELVLPSGVPPEDKARLYAEERQRGIELARDGSIRNIWRIPGAPYKTVSIRIADDPAQLQLALESLPMFDWLKIDVIALATHPIMEAAASPGSRG